ncbi:hypothetical protein C8J47_1743 [Sphingomonas sp. PP-F2F-G114-C0414]|uniref:hypothetical protein n=1 Tax=Sphingomonas sp. PP-F2F-G114-C0414 TaxID=2135662 RepID=UPI000EF873F6|nr:hypothetical protein [Sphingomonas sp. PP-F2F-G114-C0414]RMB36212.1 hypothetical protein C8J47_1743 [Sphingomonas sp. PP-F2F-G114-C0414]
MTQPHDQPRDVFQEEGEVIIDGPGGAVIAMTPEAALRTAGRLDDAALEALIARARTSVEPMQPH